MLTFILPVFSAILAAFIEWLRIANKHGKVANVSKFISVNFAAQGKLKKYIKEYEQRNSDNKEI